VFVEDLGSRNGTFVGQARVRKLAELPADEELVLAGAVRLRVEGTGSAPALILEDSLAGVRIPLRAETVRLDGEPPVELRVGRDRVWLGDREFVVGDALTVGDRTYRLARAPLDPSLTQGPAESACHLWVQLDGAPGPRARLTDAATGATLELVAPNRVVLLYVLGRQLLAGCLRHPNVCRVQHVVRVGEAPGLVMELVEGPTLHVLLASYQPNLHQIDQLARVVVAGVRAAHAAGLVHRDLKPGNVLLEVDTATVVPKVADFGLAKAIGGDDDGGHRTRSGSPLGRRATWRPSSSGTRSGPTSGRTSSRSAASCTS
jgi:hypothetical protein